MGKEMTKVAMVFGPRDHKDVQEGLALLREAGYTLHLLRRRRSG